MASLLSLAALLVALASTCFISSSAVPPGPFRGYQTSFASSQAASYDPLTGAVLSSVKVTSRQCSVIKRSTRYEKVHVPFGCHVITGHVMPLPRMTEVTKAGILATMKKSGWAVCHKVMQVPVHRFQRIPVCCPGTIPIPNGGCVCKKSLAAAQAASSMPRLPPMPSPGQLLQQMLQQTLLEVQQMHPAYQFKPTPPPARSPVVMQPPRPYRGMMARGPMVTATPGALIKQAMLQRGRGGPAYTTDKRGPDLLKHIAIKNLLSSSAPTPVAPRPPQSPLGDWHQDVARFLAAMMYQKLLVEQQQQTLQDELERQSGLRKQLELWAAQQRQLAQDRLRQLTGGRQPTSSPVSPNADPSPIPPPPVNRGQTTPFSKQPATPQTDQHTEGSAVAGQGLGQGQDDQQKDGGLWSDSQGILDKMPHLGQPAPTEGPQMFDNAGPTNMQRQPASLQSAMLELREKVKKIVDDCMARSDITNPMEQVVQTGDLTKLVPVCRASESVGPCMMEESSKTFGGDRMGLVGRQMLQSVLMSLGQMCMKLAKTDQIPAGPKMTSPPVFPNPAPSMTKEEVTPGTVEKSDADSPVAPQKTDPVEDEPAKQFANTIEQDQPSQTASPHVQEEVLEVAEASFPMWMILTMVGACAALLFFCCLTVCLVLRCRRKKKAVELDREPEKLPVPAQANIYAASPCVPPPAYATTAVRQTLGGEEEEEVMDDKNFKIPEDHPKMAQEKKVPEEKGEEQEKEEK